MFLLKIRIVAAVALASTLLDVSFAQAQDMKIDGNTWEWLGGANYQKLPDVIATVTRGGNFLMETKSADRGTVADFHLKIPSGEPINVVFHLGDGYVPEVQSLAAIANASHIVSPALVKVDDYQRRRLENKKLPSVRAKVQMALAVMGPNGDGAARSDLSRMLRRFND